MYIALDLETTGLNPEKNQIIEIAAIKIKPDGTIIEEFHSVINPNVPIPEIITHITGITNEEVNEAPTFKELKEQIQEFIGDLPIMGHSIQFDIDFLNANGIETGPALDTFRLAQTLLPQETSYSLEILSEKYNLTHTNKHRADDDTKVAIELYKMMIDQIRAIPQEIADRIHPLLNKCDWNWISTFEKFLGTGEGSPLPKTDQPKPELAAPTSEPLQSQLFESLTTHQSTLIEDATYNLSDVTIAASHFAEQNGEHVLIATPHPDQILTDARVAHLEHPGRYLNRANLENLLKKPNLTPGELRLLIKVLLWLDHTETGLKSEISIGDEEQSAWNQISDYAQIYSPDPPKENTFYGKAYKNAQYTPVTIVHSNLLLENMVRRAPIIPEKPSLILDSIEGFENIAVSALTNTFALDRFITQNNDIQERLAILFGLLKMIVDKYADQDAYNREMILESHHLSTSEWVKIKATLDGLENLMKNAETGVREQIGALKKALTPNPHILTWLAFNYKKEVLIRACPKQPSALLAQALWPKPKTLIGITSFGTFDDSFDFIKSRLQLPKNIIDVQIPFPENQDRIDFYTHDDLPSPKDTKNLSKTVEKLTSLLKERTSDAPIFLLTNSLKATEQLHGRLLTSLKTTDYNVLSQGQSGGFGKIGQLFTNNPEKALLIGTNRLYDSILKNPAAHKIDTLILHRLPFQFPWQMALKKETEDMDNSFNKYSLPTAILLFKKAIHDFKTYTSAKEMHLLDPRLGNYGGHFVKSLPDEIERMN